MLSHAIPQKILSAIYNILPLSNLYYR